MTAALPFLIALVTLPVCASLGAWIGAVSQPSPDRWVITGPIPRFAAPALLAGLAPVLEPATGLALGLLAAPGAVDDVRRLSPAVKALALLPGAVAIVATSERWELGIAAFVLANSMNLLDHVDGMAGGAALGSGLAAALSGSALSAGVAACAAAFLLYNRPPASLFLGDGGAFLLGGALVLVWAEAPWPVALAGCMLPLGDTSVVVARRLWARRAPWIGGTDHLGHALLRTGAPAWAAPALSFAAGFGAPSLARVWLDG